MTRSFVSLQSAIKAAKNAEGKCNTTQTRFVGVLDDDCLFSSLENIFLIFKYLISSAIGLFGTKKIKQKRQVVQSPSNYRN